MFSFRTKLEWDDRELLEKTEKAETRALSIWGFEAKATSQDMIKSGRDASRPGSPPNSHTGALRNFIRYGVEGNSVFVGPQLLSRKSKNVLEALERTGKSVNSKGKPQRIAVRPVMAPTLDLMCRQGLPEVFDNSILA